MVASKERNTRTGSRMAWVTLSDAAGTYEVTLFSEVLSRARPMLEEGTAVLVTAEARLENEALRLTANDVEPLERAAQGVGQGIRLWLENTAAVEPIRALLTREGRGKGRVVLVARTGQGQEVEMALPGTFAVSPKLVQAIKVVPGVAEVEDLSCPGPAGPVRLRRYRGAGTEKEAALPCLLFMHGGGWVIGDLESHDQVCRTLANYARCCVVSVDYRLAPEHKFPAAAEDGYAATRWIAASRSSGKPASAFAAISTMPAVSTPGSTLAWYGWVRSCR